MNVDPADHKPGTVARLLTRRTLAFLIGAVAVLLLAGVASNAEQFTFGTSEPSARSVTAIDGDVAPTEAPEIAMIEEPIEAPEWLAVTVAIVLGIGLLYLLSRQRFNLKFNRPKVHLARSPGIEVTEEDEAEAIAELARDLIDELNEGDSPRYAIQRAYAAVETGFGDAELARKAAETPNRYLNRIFGRHNAMQEPLAQLTDLFQHARFSDEPVDESMRGHAINALTEIRDYYQAVALNKISRSRKSSNAGAKP